MLGAPGAPAVFMCNAMTMEERPLFPKEGFIP